MSEAVSNVENIGKYLDYPTNTFYFIQVIKRRKENPEMLVAQQVLKCFYVDSPECFDKYIPRIISLCDDNNARAYINLNKRNYERVTIEMIKYLAELNISKQYSVCAKAFEKVAGRNSNETGDSKKWILDVDTKDENYINDIINYVEYVSKPEKRKVKLVNETKNGFYIICSPFDPREFKNKFMDVEIKKDNPTILYVP